MFERGPVPDELLVSDPFDGSIADPWILEFEKALQPSARVFPICTLAAAHCQQCSEGVGADKLLECGVA